MWQFGRLAYRALEFTAAGQDLLWKDFTRLAVVPRRLPGSATRERRETADSRA